MLELAHNDLNHVIPVHDDDAWQRFPTRVLASGGHIAEVTLADGAQSRISLSIVK